MPPKPPYTNTRRLPHLSLFYFSLSYEATITYILVVNAEFRL